MTVVSPPARSHHHVARPENQLTGVGFLHGGCVQHATISRGLPLVVVRTCARIQEKIEGRLKEIEGG